MKKISHSKLSLAFTAAMFTVALMACGGSPAKMELDRQVTVEPLADSLALEIAAQESETLQLQELEKWTKSKIAAERAVRKAMAEPVVPTLKIKFKKQDTDVEMILDPLNTNLVLDFKRDKDVQFEVEAGDSLYTDGSKEGKKSIADSLQFAGFDSGEDLTDDIIRDMNRAQQLFYNRDYQGALGVLKKSLEKKRTASAYALGGSIYFVNNEKEQAVRAWENALEINPDIPELVELVRRYKQNAE